MSAADDHPWWWADDDYDPGYDPAEDRIDEWAAEYKLHNAPVTKPKIVPNPDDDTDDQIEYDLLRVEPVADMVARVDAAPPRQWLVRGVIISGTYGGFAAEDTSGKSLAALDLGINVAAGGRWLDTFPIDDPGPVLMFLGEGDDHETTRRGRAIAEFYGHDFADLPMRISHRVPKLTNEIHMAYVRAEIEAHPPRLVILDPLYLAMTGVKTSDLAEVGGALAPIQHACQDHGATLWIAHHWNKTGMGTGRSRATGAGFPEWARVVGSVNVAARVAVGNASLVTLEWEIVGNSVVDTRLKIRRKVWADDVADLSSPLHYELHAVEDEEPDDERSPAQRRILAVLDGAPAPLTVREIGDLIAKDGQDMPLKRRTIQDCLKSLAEFGEATDDNPEKGHTAHWSTLPQETT